MPFIEINSNGSDALDLFEKSVQSKILSCDANQFWSCKSDFESLIASNFIAEITNNLLKDMLRDPYATDMRNQVNRTLLLQKEYYSLVLSWNIDVESNEDSLNTHGSHAMISIICSDPVEVDFYSLPEGDMEVYEPGKKISHSHTCTIDSKELIEVHGDKWIVDVKPAPNLFMVTFILEPLWSQIWAYDRSKLTSWGTSASTLNHTQIKIALQIFRLFKDENSIEVVRNLCRHPHHDIRWEAIRTLGSLKLELIEDELNLAINDTHPHIRDSAAKSLSQLHAYKKEITNGTNN